MESLQTIKNRLRAVNNIGKITKAMEVVAATKMRKAQELAVNSRPYSWHVLELLTRLVGHKNVKIPLLEEREIKNTLIIIVSSDRGLVGSFNNQLFKIVDGFVKSNALVRDNFQVITIGKKALNFAQKNSYIIEKSFLNFGNIAKPEQMELVSNTVIEGFLNDRWDRVVAVAMNFKTTLNQVPLLRQIMPINFDMIKKTVKDIVPEHGRYAELVDIKVDGGEDKTIDYIFEPSKEEILNKLTPHLIKMQFYHLMLEANASEHSARRVAMKTASDNADEVAGKLSMDYNKVRQSNITRELIEITSTQNALQN
ncbi:MAG: ATP synthase F1 subunit gamma [Candidatus Vogelbacteria bacterium]|nr:ATP synthase F1 subunit gamma [Candidatus Vogelbacteria bacterium]